MEKFTIGLPSGRLINGREFLAEQPIRNLLIMEGMNEHSLRYKDLALYFNSLGINVYVLDSFGQGLNVTSPEEQEKWHKGAFDENVKAAHIKIEEVKKSNLLPTSLMGHSMGSFMSQRFIELYPESVDSVILCGTNGPAKGKMSSAYFLASILTNKKNWDKPSSFLNNMGLGAYSRAIKVRRTDLDWLSYNSDNVDQYIKDPYCGHADTHGFWKEFLRGMNELYKAKWLKRISPKERILIIAGAEDPVGEFGKGPKRLAEMYKKLGLSKVTLTLYPGLRHEIHNEKDHLKVYKAFSDFLLRK
jgi:alpha-beta hydrolase superfamily lysophospholipase